MNRRSLLVGGGALTIASLMNRPVALASPTTFTDRVAGALYGLAIGDGMGAPVEGWSSARVREQFGDHDFTTFLPATKPELIGTNLGKGDGRITDDSLLVEALIRAYDHKRDHLDAHDFAALFVPEYAETIVWVPERGTDMPSIERPLWFPERYSHRQLALYGMEPRRAGHANRETQSYCGYTMPIGAVNAGDPDSAYREAADFGLATQSSYGLEAGAVTAASFAAALAADSTVASVIEAAHDLARDGTRSALDAVLPHIDPSQSEETFIHEVRSRYLPWSGIVADKIRAGETDIQDARISAYGEPSRIISIENPIVSLAALKWAGADFTKAIRVCVLYGQDCESIAAHTAGLIGALSGYHTIPANLRRISDHNNRRDRIKAAHQLVSVAREIAVKDASREAATQTALLSSSR